MIKVLFGTVLIQGINVMAIYSLLSGSKLFYYLNAIVASLTIYFLIYQYFQSDFYKSLKYPLEKNK